MWWDQRRMQQRNQQERNAAALPGRAMGGNQLQPGFPMRSLGQVVLAVPGGATVCGPCLKGVWYHRE